MNKNKKWHWPKYSPRYDDIPDRKELQCEHGVGHGGLHGCDGCCSSPEFKKRYEDVFGKILPEGKV